MMIAFVIEEVSNQQQIKNSGAIIEGCRQECIPGPLIYCTLKEEGQTLSFQLCNEHLGSMTIKSF
jgi:hypothetical protein